MCNTPGYPSTTTFKSSIIMAFRKSDLYASQFTQPANSINYLMWTGAEIAASVPPVTPPAVAFKPGDCFHIQASIPQSEVDSQRNQVLFVCQVRVQPGFGCTWCWLALARWIGQWKRGRKVLMSLYPTVMLAFLVYDGRFKKFVSWITWL